MYCVIHVETKLSLAEADTWDEADAIRSTLFDQGYNVRVERRRAAPRFTLLATPQ